MNQELKDKWITALTDGSHLQGQSQLREGDLFCCLGVLCDVIDPSAWTDLNNDGVEDGNMRWHGADGDLAGFSKVVVRPGSEKAEFVSIFAELFGPEPEANFDHVHNKLIHLNDVERANFPVIAEYIKVHLEVSQP